MGVVEVRDEGAVRVIALNLPERRNATSPALMAAVNDALPMPGDELTRDVVITGNGPSFSSGGDIKAKTLPIEPGSRRMREVFNPTMLRLATLPLPVIAAVNGPALGAGLSLALVADLRVASRRAVFASGFVEVGLATDGGASLLLPRLIGYGRAFELLTTVCRIGPEDALAMGLVNRVVEPTDLMASALELAQSLAAKPGIAVPAVKELLRMATHSTMAEQLEAEAMMYDRTSTHPQRNAAKQAMVARMSSTGSEATPSAQPESRS
jgi:2-(1,2-epoxy-1,2-dihydrophenyl)acetyl-CoA isomerase